MDHGGAMARPKRVLVAVAILLGSLAVATIDLVQRVQVDALRVILIITSVGLAFVYLAIYRARRWAVAIALELFALGLLASVGAWVRLAPTQRGLVWFSVART